MNKKLKEQIKVIIEQIEKALPSSERKLSSSLQRLFGEVRHEYAALSSTATDAQRTATVQTKKAVEICKENERLEKELAERLLEIKSLHKAISAWQAEAKELDYTAGQETAVALICVGGLPVAILTSLAGEIDFDVIDGRVSSRTTPDEVIQFVTGVAKDDFIFSMNDIEDDLDDDDV